MPEANRPSAEVFEDALGVACVELVLYRRLYGRLATYPSPTPTDVLAEATELMIAHVVLALDTQEEE